MKRIICRMRRIGGELLMTAAAPAVGRMAERPADPRAGRLRRRRRHRYRVAHHRRAAVRGAETVGHRREQGGRRRHARRRDMSRAPNKDGYTALMTSPAHTVSAAMLKSVLTSRSRDYAPVSWVADSAFVFVAKKGFPGQRHQGVDRAGQGVARQAQLCRRRRRLDPEFRRRTAAPDGRHRRQAHSLSQHARRGRGLALGRGGLRRRTGARGEGPGRRPAS